MISFSLDHCDWSHYPECLAEIGVVDADNSTSEQSHLRQIFANKDVHLLAAFILIYVGAEVSFGGS